MVAQNGLPVVMYVRGTVRPISTDPAVVSLAEEAVKAYQAGAPSGVAGAAGTSAPPSAGTASSTGLTVDGVISLVGAGISDDLIIAKIQKSGQTFDLSTDDMVRLKKAGASDTVMKAMMSGTPAPAAASAVPAAARMPLVHRRLRLPRIRCPKTPAWASSKKRDSWRPLVMGSRTP